jgi:glyoxylase-like metal-dependent hydrolase (beta-lactamase superfamily II)
MELTELAPDVYACLQEDRGFGWSNSGFVNRGGGLVVDTFFDVPHTRRMLELYGKVSSGAPRRLVNTHHNGDHCWGNQLLADAEIIGHRLCAEAMRSDLQPEVMRAAVNAENAPPGIALFAEDVRDFDFSGIDITPPTTFVEERLALDLDGEGVEVLYVGPAHTAGDVIVHLPDRGVLFGGDVMWRHCTPIGWEGTTDGWLAALDTILELAPEVVVPGHGPPCGLDGVRELRAYFCFVREEARDGFAAGRTVLDAAKRIDLGPYADWNQPERLVFSVARVYRELRGEAWDEPVDAMALLDQTHALREHLRQR